ncbi:MAG: 50S ribosomal protein L30 [Longimicrobiales bacterium]
MAASARADVAPARLRVTQIRSGIGRPAKHRATLKALGIRHHQQSVVHEDTPSIRGMLFQVRHLVRVEELAGDET